MKNIIESLDNSKIKEIRSLHKKKYRKNHGKYLIEGKRIVIEALRHGTKIDKVIITPEFCDAITLQEIGSESELKNIDVLMVTKKVFNSLATTDSPQGIMAVVYKENLTLDEVLANIPENPFIVTLERVQDPGNMGTIIRTAEAAGVDLIVVTKSSTDPYGDKALRSSMGAVFLIPIIEVEGMDWIERLRKRQIRFIATDLSAKKSYSEVEYKGGVNIIIGNEGHGISRELLDQADEKTVIPIYGNIESLNASIASGILLYKARESRDGF